MEEDYDASQPWKDLSDDEDNSDEMAYELDMSDEEVQEVFHFSILRTLADELSGQSSSARAATFLRYSVLRCTLGGSKSLFKVEKSTIFILLVSLICSWLVGNMHHF